MTPKGDSVLVEFEFDRKHSVPADAKAAVVAPSLVSDRYVCLFPAFQGGPRWATRRTIGLDRTAVPVELDRISEPRRPARRARPSGRQRGGRVLAARTETGNLEGQGQAIHDSNRDLSRALETLSGGRNDLFGTVKNLQSFTSMLATNDQQVRRLNKDLATVSTQLDGERDDLSAALKNLAIALNGVDLRP